MEDQQEVKSSRGVRASFKCQSRISAVGTYSRIIVQANVHKALSRVAMTGHYNGMFKSNRLELNICSLSIQPLTLLVCTH